MTVIHRRVNATVHGVGRGKSVSATRGALRASSVLCALVASALAATPANAEESFKKEIAPILVRSCVACHGEKTALGGWRAHTVKALFAAGKSGKIPVVPGKPEKSELYRRVTSHDPSLRMPSGDDPLPAKAIGQLRRWILAGAPTDALDPATLLSSLEGPRNHPNAPAVYRNPVPVAALAVSPDGKTVAVGGYHEVLLRDTSSGALVRRIGKLPQRVMALTWSRDGKQLLVGGGTPGEYGEATLAAADGSGRKVLGVFPDLVLAVGFSPDEKRVVAGGADFSARCYEVSTGTLRWSHKVHADWVTGIGFTGDGKYVASSGRDKVVKVYEAESGTLFTTYNGHNRNIGRFRGQAPVWGLAFPPDSPLVLSAGGGAWVQAWEPEKAQKETGDAGDMEERFQTGSHARHLAHGLTGAVLAVSVSGGTVFAAGEQGVAVAIDMGSQSVKAQFGKPGEWAHAVSADPAGRVLAVGRYDGTVAVYDTESGAERARFSAVPVGQATASRKSQTTPRKPARRATVPSPK